MKKIFLIASLALWGLKINVDAQTPDSFWARQLGGTDYDWGSSIAVDVDGNVYTTGHFRGTVDFDPSTETYYLASTTYDFDIFLSKLDASGNFLWAKQMGGISSDEASEVAVDNAGNVYVTGGFEDTADFDPDSGVYHLTSAGSSDIFLSKLDASGKLLWAMRMGGASSDWASDIAVDNAGYVYLTGTFQDTTDFNPNIGTYSLTSFGDRDIFILKLDPSGNFLWARQLGGASYDYGSSITVDANGNVYATGWFQDTADFDPGAGSYELISASAYDAFVSKLDAKGNFLWATQISGEGNQESSSIAIDAYGNVYTTGKYQFSTDFDGCSLYTLGNFDIFISKLDAFGNCHWAKRLEGPDGEDWGRSIAVDTSGNIYTTGVFYYEADFDPGVGIANLISAGNRDVFISKLNPSGNFVYAGRLGGTNEDYGNSIVVDANGCIYTTGSFQDTSSAGDFDPSDEIYELTSFGEYDVFVIKLCPEIVSTTDPDSKYKITVSPNPTQNTLNIRCEGGSTTSVQVSDNLGRLILEDNSFALDGATRTLFLGKVPSGTYNVKVAGDRFVRVVSIVKN